MISFIFQKLGMTKPSVALVLHAQMATQITSRSRQDYLKAILSFQLKGIKVSTSAIATKLNSKPASVTGMFKVLSDLELIEYKPYRGVSLTSEGRTQAIALLRKHRLWETFMFENLGFGWDEVHEVAEQLEHVDSSLLIDKLDAFLGFPRFDPHGDPIPDAEGNMFDKRNLVQVHTLKKGVTASIQGVLGSSDAFLKHLGENGVQLGLVFIVKKVYPFDGSMLVSFENSLKTEVTWSKKLVEQLLAEVK